MSDLKIGVIGLGKLGLPLAVTLANTKFSVVGFDQNLQLVHDLNTRVYQSVEPGVNESLENRSISEVLTFTSSLSELEECTLFYIIVPTPSEKLGKFSSKHVENVVATLATLFRESPVDRCVVIVSTLMPGETRRISKKYLPETRIKLLYSPEFIALGTVIRNLTNPDSILVGCENPDDAQTHIQVQRRITGGAPESILNWEEAEIVKLLVNCYVTMKISFANFVGEVADVMAQVNPIKVSEALGLDSRIGALYLRPGLGFAGPCFPRDNFALLSWAKDVGLQANLSAATVAINDRQPQMAANRILRVLAEDQVLTLIGVVYKPYTEVTDHSQTLSIARVLKARGVEVEIYDPFLSDNDRENLGKTFRVLNELEESTSLKTVIVSREFLPILNLQDIQFENVILM